MKINRKIIFILLLSPFLMCTYCGLKETEDCHPNFYVQNNSDKTIRITTSTTYPDSATLDGIRVTGDHLAKPGERLRRQYDTCFEDRVFRVNEYGVIMIYLWDNSVYEKYPPEELIVNQMWLRKYDMDTDEFQKMNWIITYP